MEQIVARTRKLNQAALSDAGKIFGFV